MVRAAYRRRHRGDHKALCSDSVSQFVERFNLRFHQTQVVSVMAGIKAQHGDAPAISDARINRAPVSGSRQHLAKTCCCDAQSALVSLPDIELDTITTRRRRFGLPARVESRQ